MRIENKKRASILRLVYLAIPVFYTLLISLSYFFKGFPNYTYLSIVVVFFVLTIMLLRHLKLHYVIFNQDEGKLIIRYLTLGPFGGSRKSMEMPQKDFVSYQITRKSYGYKKDMVIYRQTPKGIAKYPPISISAFSDEEIAKIEKMLNALILKNKKGK